MSNKRRRNRCKYHILGQYYIDNGLINFCIGEDIPKTKDGPIYYVYCPMCGTHITEKIKIYQMELNKTEDEFRKADKINKQKKLTTRKICRIPKKQSRFKKKK